MANKSTMVLVAVPAQHFRMVAQQLKQINFTGHLVICCKGIEQGSLKLMSEIASEVIPEALVAILSGPNFAHEIAANLPAAATIAASNLELAQLLANKFSGSHFRVYSSNDMISSQICGAAKNVLAIACGISIGKNFGENARAALITRGIAEIKRLAIAKGGDLKTIMGLSGVGDIILTCNSPRSRNTSVGIELAHGKKLANILKDRITVAEGIHTAKSITDLAKVLKINMPIAEAINDILYNEGNVDKMINDLLSRPLSDE
jgi:glycerol-3-phosphate dehydrogenase (NAD(P)+)